ncbi:MAG: FAD-dependent oxidoreductase [Armatimonadetes bacterium]|nr:FAD-dependent oxidoreductase [Armatimonadota bacterium]
MPTVSFSRELPLRHDVDVFVAGGGPAGIAATLAARAQGASVLVIDGHTCFGGMGTAALVPAFMQFGDGVNFLADGIGRRVFDLMWARNAHGPDDDRERSQWGSLGIRAEALKRIYDDLITESGAAYALGTNLVGVETAGRRIDHVVCWGKSGLFAVRAKVYVDATGDGDLSAWAGASYEQGDADGGLMPGTLCSLWTDIDWAAVRADGRYAQNVIPQAIADGVIEVDDPHLPGMWRLGEHLGGGNIGHTFGVDNTDERSVTEALIYGRRLLGQYERFYKEYLRGYERMELATTGSLLGVRETRRIVGDYQLCLDDFNQRAVFDDEVGRYSYPVDIHATRPSKENFGAFWAEFHALRYQPGESYGIPYRCLLPRDLDNALVAGRCLSADRFLQGSVRVMPGCFITGQAAGVAAALAVEQGSGPRDVAVGALHQRLKALGAWLPNAG